MKRDLYRYIAIIFITLTIWLSGIPYLFSKAIPVICENLSYNSSYNIVVENPQLILNVVPVATIKAKSISIKSKNSEDYYLVDSLNIKARILPLLSGRMHLNNIKADNVEVNSVLDTKPELDKNFLLKLKNTKLFCQSVDISKMQINLLQKANNQKAVYKADNLFYINNGRYLKFNIESFINIDEEHSQEKISIYIPKDNNVTKSLINIYIKNLDIAPIAEYLKNYLPKDLICAKGVIDVDTSKQHLSAVFKNIEIVKKDEAKSMIFPKEIKIDSDLNLTRKIITVNNAIIQSPNIDLVMGGTISNYLDKPFPSYNLKFRLNKSKIEDFISLLPPFKTEDIDVYKLKKYKFYGDIIGNFSVKGENLEPLINGSIYINNGILTKPIENAKGATVKLDFKGKYLNYDVNVPAGRNEKVNVKGGVELYNVKYADMRVWSTKNVDLATAEEKVVPIHEILNFVIGPVPIMDIKGRGNIDINVKGNRKNPHVWGILNFADVTTYFKEMPDLVLKDADAVLSFDDENAVFSLKKGFINGKDININGTCNVGGKFDFDVKTTNQDLGNLYKAVKTSTMIDDIKKMLPEFSSVHGLSDINLKVYGNIKDIEYTKFNENFFTKGSIELLGNTFELNNVNIHGAKGVIKFNNTNAQVDVSSFIGHSPLELVADIKNNYADAVISIPKLNLRDIVSKNDKFGQDIANIFVDIKAKYKGRTDSIEYNKADFSAQILDVAPNNKLKLSKGQIILKNGKLIIKQFNGWFDETKSNFNINIQADNIDSQPVINGDIQLNDFELRLINSFSDYGIIPQNLRKIMKQIHFVKGKINLNAKISNNNVNLSTNVGGIEFRYLPIELPVQIINGSLYIRKNYLGLNKINMIADDMPILVDGGVNNIFTKQDFNLYVNSKPKQSFVDKYLNNNNIYPLKIRGDIIYSAKIKGPADNINVITEANLAKDASIYYLGATVGDLENSIIIHLDANILKRQLVKIKEFSYDKLIDSQGKRQTRLNMLKSAGDIELLKNDLLLRDLKIKTSHPVDARIFNILFRKSEIKQGQFTSDLRLNGRLSNPHMEGTFRIMETNIPFLDITMKNLSFVFKDKTIDLLSNGEILGNDVAFKGTLRNKLSVPYYVENAELYTKVVDFNYITNRLKTVQAEDIVSFDSSVNAFDIKNTVIKNLKLKADEIKLRNITASDVEAVISLNEKKSFNIDKFKFYIADGILDGRFSYNLVNNNTWIHLNAKDINANDMAIALFDLNNQIYGDLTGNVKLSCNGSEFKKCMETLNGSLNFDVKDGRMPKLGSLEYLLKAGNLVKGGLTGLSINSVIDILMPLKTGNFTGIVGSLTIKNGVTDDIGIASKGKDLSLFMSGSYNFATSNAEMEVLGLLSKNISTMFGPLGNVSLNTLFNVVPGINLDKDSALLDKINKIPGIELNNKAFRKFMAEINGNINGENYVKSFKWIN